MPGVGGDKRGRGRWGLRHLPQSGSAREKVRVRVPVIPRASGWAAEGAGKGGGKAARQSADATATRRRAGAESSLKDRRAGDATVECRRLRWARGVFSSAPAAAPARPALLALAPARAAFSFSAPRINLAAVERSQPVAFGQEKETPRGEGSEGAR